MFRFVPFVVIISALLGLHFTPARADITPAGRSAALAALTPAGSLVDSPQVESYILRVRIYTRGDDSQDTVLILDSGLDFKHCAKRAMQLGNKHISAALVYEFSCDPS